MKMRSPLVAAALAAAVAFAGCGDDDKKPEANGGGGATVDETVQPTQSPEELWAAKFCAGLVKNATTLQPPKVDGSDPAATQKELVRFFDEVADQLDGQLDQFKAVGAPPSVEEQKAWKAARAELRDTLDKVKGLRRAMRSQDLSSKSDVTQAVDQLASDFKVLNEYLGPVDGLSKDPDLKAALLNEPACANVS